MKTVAKMKCTSKTEHEGSAGVLVHFEAVTGGSEENEAFFAATPSGSVQLNVKPEIAAGFELGRAYYVEFRASEEKI